MTAGGSTPVHGLPWPDGGAAADGSQDIKDLADAAEVELIEHDTAIAGKADIAYVDQIVTVSSLPPTGADVPVRAGLLWVVAL